MEIRINREVRNYHESIFFGLSARQFCCSLGAVAVAVELIFYSKVRSEKKRQAGSVCSVRHRWPPQASSNITV